MGLFQEEPTFWGLPHFVTCSCPEIRSIKPAFLFGSLPIQASRAKRTQFYTRNNRRFRSRVPQDQKEGTPRTNQPFCLTQGQHEDEPRLIQHAAHQDLVSVCTPKDQASNCRLNNLRPRPETKKILQPRNTSPLIKHHLVGSARFGLFFGVAWKPKPTR